MTNYIAHIDVEKARKIMRDLQVKDLANCYVCPLLNFSCIEPGEISSADMLELHLDILSNSDTLIVPSEAYIGVQMEIAFAKLVGMEIRYLD